MSLDQRRQPRVKVKLKAHYTSPLREMDATIMSISEAGLFLYSLQLDPEGTPVRLEFAVGARTVRVMGEVIYTGFQDGLRGMGVRFSRVLDADREVIVKLVRDVPAAATA